MNHKICDLHTHSVFSDGTCTPTELIDMALEKGLSAIALCDHNTVDGLPEFLQAATGKPIQAVPSAEFSVDYNGKELHLLGLFIPEKHFSDISALIQESARLKEESNFALVESLRSAGYILDFEELKNSTQNGRFNRAHIAAALTQKGYTESISQAFKELLSPSKGYYVPPKRIIVWEMLDFIKSISAVPVLAHPFLNLTEEALREFLPLAIEHGLAGMECMYSTYDSEKTQKSLEISKEFNLKPSGGSNFHGANKPDIHLGTGKGDLMIPYEWMTVLQS